MALSQHLFRYWLGAIPEPMVTQITDTCVACHELMITYLFNKSGV